jgi:hypothetical protein
MELIQNLESVSKLDNLYLDSIISILSSKMTNIIAWRESLGIRRQDNPLAEGEQHYRLIVRRFQRRVRLFIENYGFTIGYNVCRHWRLNPNFQTAT